MDTMDRWRGEVWLKFQEWEEQARAQTKSKEATAANAKLGPLPGGYKIGQKVKSTHDISVKGKIIVKSGSKGVVFGPSQRDPLQRIIVQFANRDRKVSVTVREVKLAT